MLSLTAVASCVVNSKQGGGRRALPECPRCQGKSWWWVADILTLVWIRDQCECTSEELCAIRDDFYKPACQCPQLPKPSGNAISNSFCGCTWRSWRASRIRCSSWWMKFKLPLSFSQTTMSSSICRLNDPSTSWVD